jgi:3-hydroxyisobutyrate dehydrogenase-like beta-hydroxyacid dehydrogenase
VDVGFVGLGRMGSAIAGRVLGAGHDVVVWNRTRAKTAPLDQAGARVAATVADACSGREVVITMLADDNALQEVALTSGGIRDSLASGSVHLAMGTHGVATIKTLADAHVTAGQAFVAAPVLGRPDVAAEGRLGIVAAGPAVAVERCTPLFEAIGRRTFRAGERPEGAAAVKLANNFLLGCAIEAMGEAFSLVRKYELEPEVLLDVLTDGLFGAPAYEVYGRIIVERAYERVGFTTSLALKDVNLILAAAGLAHVPLPSANVYRDRLLSAIAHGAAEHDWAVMAQEQARASGLE